MYQGRRVDGRTKGRRSDAHMHPSAMFLPSPVKADRPTDPQCTYSSSRSSPSPITIMPRVAPVGASRSMIWHQNPAMETKWASCFEGSIKKSGMANVTASLTSGDDSLSLLFSPPSLTPPLSQKSSSRESDRGCVRPSTQTSDREKPGRALQRTAEVAARRKRGVRGRASGRPRRKTSFDF